MIFPINLVVAIEHSFGLRMLKQKNNQNSHGGNLPAISSPMHLVESNQVSTFKEPSTK